MKKKFLSLLCLVAIVSHASCNKAELVQNDANLAQEKIDLLEKEMQNLRSNYDKLQKQLSELSSSFKSVKSANENAMKKEPVSTGAAVSSGSSVGAASAGISDNSKIGFSIDATARWFCNGSGSAYSVSMPSTTQVGDPKTGDSQFTSNILASKIKFSKEIQADDGLSINPYFELGINETEGEETKSNGHLLKLRQLGALIKKKSGNKTHGFNIGQTSSSFAPRMPGLMLCPIRQMVLHYSLEQGNLKENNYHKLLVGLENAETEGAVSSLVDKKRVLKTFTTGQGMGDGIDLLSPDFVAKYAYNNFEIRSLLRIMSYSPKNSNDRAHTAGGGLGMGYNFVINNAWNIYTDINGGIGAARYMSNISNHSMLIKDGKKVDSLRHLELYLNTSYKAEKLSLGFETSLSRYFYPKEISDEHKNLKKYSLGAGATVSYAVNKYLAPYVGFYYCMVFDHNNDSGHNPALHVGMKLDV